MKRRNCVLAVTAALALSGCVMLPPPPPLLPPPPPLAFRPPGSMPDGRSEGGENFPPMFRPGRQP